MHQPPTISKTLETLFIEDGLKMINSDDPDKRVLGAIVLRGLYEFGEKLSVLNKKHGLDNTDTENTMAMLKQIINDA